MISLEFLIFQLLPLNGLGNIDIYALYTTIIGEMKLNLSVLLYLYSVEGIVIVVVNTMDLNNMVFSFN